MRASTRLSISSRVHSGRAPVPGQVRALLGFRLTEWKLPHLLPDLELIAAELVTNAVTTTPDAQIRVACRPQKGGVWFGVWDSSTFLPVVKPVTELSLADIDGDPEALNDGHDDGTGGWGLPIVRALSADCGVRKTPPAGKWVWSLIAG